MSNKAEQKRKSIEHERKRIDIWLALIAIAAATALYLLPRKTEPVIIGCLFLIWVTLLYPMLSFWWIGERFWRKSIAVSILTAALVFWGWNIEPEHSNEHTVFDFDQPFYPTDLPPQTPFREGQVPTLDLGFSNNGDFIVHNPDQAFYMAVVPHAAVYDNLFEKYRNHLVLNEPDWFKTDFPPHTTPHQHAYLRYHGSKLTQEDASGLNDGSEVLAVVGLAVWQDKSGRYENHFSQYLRRDQNGTYNWHLENENQREIRLGGPLH
jgi:hypothetical protein